MAQVAALPIAALDAYAAVLDVLQLTPRDGEPQHKDNPDGAVRRWTFGPEDAGQIIYLILDEQREIHLLLVQWIG